MGIRQWVWGMSILLSVGTSFLAYAAPASPQLERPRNVRLDIVGFQVGTSMHFRAELIGQALRKEYPDWNIKSVSTSKGVADVQKHIKEKTSQFCLTLGPWKLEIEAYSPFYRQQGINFEKEFAWLPVMPVNKKPVHFFVLADTGFTSVKDIVSKKYPLKIGYSVPVQDPLFRRIIEFYGGTPEQIKSWGGGVVNVSFGAPIGPEMMSAGKINSGLAWAGIPNPAFLEGAASNNWRQLPLAEEDELLKKLNEIEFYRDIIPASTYPWLKKDLVTVAQTEWLGAIPGTLPKDIVYWVVKGLWNQRKYLISGFGEFADVLDPKFINSAMKLLGNPPHPEAVKFYQEEKWIK